MEKLINSDNWNFSRFQNEKYTAMISLGADPDTSDFLYYLTVMDNEEEFDLHQEVFSELEPALNAINRKYAGFWEFKDLSQGSKKSGGCSTCVAH
jgi:hypothetical protein